MYKGAFFDHFGIIYDSRQQGKVDHDLIEKKHDEASEIALNLPAECLMIPENISSESIGKRYYEQYMKGYHEKWVGRIKDKGKYSFVHLDGTMRGLIKELSDAGFDVIEVMKSEPRYVLGVGDQVVPGASFERIKRVGELTEKYGKY